MILFDTGVSLACCARRRLISPLLLAVLSACSGENGVNPATPDAVEVNAPSSSFMVGGSQQLTARVIARGTLLPGVSPSWNSSNGAVVTVTGSGQVTALSRGNAVVTATAGAAKGSVALSVLGVRSLSVQPAVLALTAGTSQTLTANIDSDVGVSFPVTWSTSNAAIATVSTNGTVTGIALGNATITAKAGGETGSATVSVREVPVASVAVVPSTATLPIGQTTQLAAIVKDSAGGSLTDRIIGWTSNAPAIATVSSSGVVTAIATGTATITATTGGKSGTAMVSVPVPVASVSIAINSTTLYVGQSTQAIATARDTAGEALAGRNLTWTTSNPLVASVSATGTISAIAPGTASVSVSSEGRKATVVMTVSPDQVVSIGAGNSYACALKGSGRLYCWGLSHWGASSTIPTAVAPEYRWSQIATGSSHICGLTFERRVYCWGRNRSGALGIGLAKDTTISSPTLIQGGLQFAELSQISTLWTCGVSFPDRSLYCWGGLDGFGVENSPNGVSSNEPRRIVSAPPLRDLSGGGGLLCGRTEQLASYCTGFTGFETLQSLTLIASPPGQTGIFPIGQRLACSVTESNQAWCFGQNSFGELGPTIGSTVSYSNPVRIGQGISWAKFSFGVTTHWCGLDTSNRAYCWGTNASGEVGDGTTALRTLPTQIPGTYLALVPSNSVYGSGSGDFTCGLSMTREVFCWGHGNEGQIGDGSYMSSLVPKKVVIP